jgi:type I restriction enzyme M protein
MPLEIRENMPYLKPFYPIDPSSWRLTIANAQRKDSDENLVEPRELVRQWVLREIMDSYQYPRDWIGTRIIAVEPDSAEAWKSNLFGLCILTAEGRPFIWFSIGAPGEAERAEEKLKSLLLKEPIAGVGMSTDSTVQGTKFIRRRFDVNECIYIRDLEPFALSDTTIKSVHTLWETARNGSALPVSDQFSLLSERVEDVFFDVHSHIRDIDGMHADEALDELCKILYAKLYEEERASSQKSYRMLRKNYGSNEELAAIVRSIYEEANTHDSRMSSMMRSDYKHSRSAFDVPIRLSNPALTKVVETLQCYDIIHSKIDIKGRAFQKVLTPSARAGMGQYFTPHQIAVFMAQIADPKISDSILDPFCGSGHFLTTCLQEVKKEAVDRNVNYEYWKVYAFEKLHGIEKSDRMVRIAMTDMRLHGDGHSNIRCTDALLAFSNYTDLSPEAFDLILTNPPFGSLLNSSAISQLGHFALAEKRHNVPLEILGLERCMQFLRPGGRLGIVLPDGILANRATGYVREWLERHAKLRAIISLPIETFVPFGASIKTSVLFVRKWRQGEKKESEYPVFLARVDNVGYDATARQRDGSDLNAVCCEVKKFLAKEGW